MMRPGDAFYGPPLAIPIDGGRGYEYPPTREVFVGVTSVLKALQKESFVASAAKETARLAYQQREALVRLTDEDAALNMLKGARYAALNRGGYRGTVVHRAIEALATGGTYPQVSPTQAPYVEQALAFADKFAPTFRTIEGTVFNAEHRYGGTFDFLAEIDGLPVLGDWKTAPSGVWPESVLQLAALRYATEIWDPDTGDLAPMPQVAGCVAVHLQPDGYRVIELRADRDQFEVFVALCRVWDWWRDGGEQKGSIGPTLSPLRLSRTFGAVSA